MVGWLFECVPTYFFFFCSEVYCHGRLLHTVQMAQLFDDSKTFVDMKLKLKPTETIERFEDFMLQNNDQPTRKQIEEFVNDHFEDGKLYCSPLVYLMCYTLSEAWSGVNWADR